MLINSELDVWLMGLMGLLVGSFLNVVIHRLPKMMEQQWATECASITGKDAIQTEQLNLITPRSRCPKCANQIRWYENIPVLSYIFLQGKCSSCHARIGLRYPIIELICGMAFAGCAWRWGSTPTSAAWCFFCAVIVALAAIDWDTTLLPDDLTLPLVWTGLCVASLKWTETGLTDALWGAVAGYLSLWIVFWGFKLSTGKEGMGYGDFKLFSALGAWFGWQALIPIILMASIIGAIIGILMKITATGLREGGYMPFGPFLALAGLTALIVSPTQMLIWVGL